MDSITTVQNNDPVNSEAALNLCLQLWHQGGLTASKAALLLAAVPALRSLLQPIIQPKRKTLKRISLAPLASLHHYLMPLVI